jgi:hypothetical protein
LDERLSNTNQRAMPAARKPVNSSSNRGVDMEENLVKPF